MNITTVTARGPCDHNTPFLRRTECFHEPNELRQTLADGSLVAVNKAGYLRLLKPERARVERD
tara:strand:- start:1589 stop:1777 length:189 start_codon:yes stop_codon:yes gene_type:complete